MFGSRMAKKNRFTEILAALLEENGTNAREAARIAGTPPSTLASWLRGHVPSDFQAIQRLAAHFGTSMSFLLTGEHELAFTKTRAIAELLESRGILFDGYLKVRIEHISLRDQFDQKGTTHALHTTEKKGILIVDDFPDQLILSGAVLGRQYDVTSAPDGEAALALLGRGDFDLVITDLDMPFDGGRMVGKLREMTLASQPRIILASGDCNVCVKAQGLGCDGYLEKPFHADQLMTLVEQVLSGPSAYANRYSQGLRTLDRFRREINSGRRQRGLGVMSGESEDTLLRGLANLDPSGYRVGITQIIALARQLSEG